MAGENVWRREYPRGEVLRARVVEHSGADHLAVQWLNPNGQPAHQPLLIDLGNAEAVLLQLAAYARELAG